MKPVELAQCIGHVCRGDLNGFRFLVLQFQFAAQFLKLLLQCMDLRDIGTLVQIGGSRLPGKAQPLDVYKRQDQYTAGYHRSHLHPVCF